MDVPCYSLSGRKWSQPAWSPFNPPVHMVVCVIRACFDAEVATRQGVTSAGKVQNPLAFLLTTSNFLTTAGEILQIHLW